MARIVFVGAGSTVFARNLIGDILSFPELADSELVLHDIDEVRLATSDTVAHRIADSLGVRPMIESTTDRRRALDGADYVISMFQVGGYQPATVIDFEVPRRYGLRQTIGDTLGIGGIMRGLRTVPVMAEMCREMEALCPDALHLNYVNPMAINCWALSRLTSITTVGLCHSVQGTAEQLCADLGIPVDEVQYRAAGINHMAFYLQFERHGIDLMPQLLQVAHDGADPRRPMGSITMADRVRYEVLRRTGYFVTESSEHFSEYTPWFIKRDRPDLIECFDIPLDEYPRRCEEQIAGWEALRERLERDDRPITVRRSHEFGSGIIHSIETGTPRVIYGNVPNEGLIDNLPAGCCVEVPCTVDGDGVHPSAVGALPPHLAALIQTNVNVQSLTVEALVTGRREHVYHAAMLDPHTAAELDLAAIWSLVDDLLEAHGDAIPPALRR
ncbi:MAG: alpha-glucosidase/alpha-galactosidase [Ilumatobacteraceae bacterium]